jgi:hypothetical protein
MLVKAGAKRLCRCSWTFLIFPEISICVLYTNFLQKATLFTGRQAPKFVADSKPELKPEIKTNPQQ